MLVRLFQRNHPNSEKRFHPSQEPPEWISARAGYDSATGISVTPESALSITAYWACIRVLAETLAMLPFGVFQKNGRERREASEHYLHTILHDQANPEMTSFEFRETIMGHVASWGNGFAEIDWDSAGRVRALWPLPPNQVTLSRIKGELVYTVKLARPDANGKTERSLFAYRVWHLRGLSSNGLVGLTPAQVHKQALGLALATEEFGARWFGGGGIPSGVLEAPMALNDKAYTRLTKSWDEAHGGLSNSHRTALLEQGVKYHQIGIPPEDSQFLETRKFQVSEVARMHRMQAHKIGDLENATFSNIEHLGIEFVTDTMMPWFVKWEQSANRYLLLPSERGAKYYTKFNVNALLRGDAASRAAFYDIMRRNGAYNADDLLEMEDQNPLPEGKGQAYWMPLNMLEVESPENLTPGPSPKGGEGGTPENIESDKGLNGAQIKAAIDILAGLVNGTVAEGVAVELLISLGIAADKAEKMVQDTLKGNLKPVEGKSAPPPATSPPAPLPKAERGVERGEVRAKNAATMRHRLIGQYQKMFVDVFGRVMRRERNDVMAQAKKTLPKRSVSDFQNWLDEFYRAHEGWTFDQVLPVYDSYMTAIRNAVGDEVSKDAADVDMDKFLRSYVGSYARRYSRKQYVDLTAKLDAWMAKKNADELIGLLEAEFDAWMDDRPGDFAGDETVRANNGFAKGLYGALGMLHLRWVNTGESCPYCDDLDGMVIEINSWFLEPGEFEPEGSEGPLTVSSQIGHPPVHRGCDCMIVAG